MATRRKALKNIQTQLKKAEEFKTKGNFELIKGKALIQHTAGKSILTDACQLYVKALECLNVVEEYLVSGVQETSGASNDEIMQRWTSLSVSLYLNLSLAGLLCEDYNSGLRSAEKVLTMDENNTKALYRKAKCFIGQGKHADALETLDTALAISPKSKDVRREKKKLMEMMEKKRKKEEFERETRKGLERVERKKEEQSLVERTEAAKQAAKRAAKQAAKRAAEHVVAVSKETIHEMIARVSPTNCGLLNGGTGPCSEEVEVEVEVEEEEKVEQAEKVGGVANKKKTSKTREEYVWGQTKEAVHVLLAIDKSYKTSNINVSFKRTSLGLTLNSGSRVLVCPLSMPVRVDDCTWMFEQAGMLHLELSKETSGVWWSNLTPGHSEIDISLCDDGDMLMADVPSSERSTYQRAMVEEMEKTSEEREKGEREARMVEEWREQRRRDNMETRTTMSVDENKRFMYERLKEQFPDVNIQLKRGSNGYE